MKAQIEKVVALVTKTLLQKKGFYGKIQLNFQAGVLVNANIEESVRLESGQKQQ